MKLSLVAVGRVAHTTPAAFASARACSAAWWVSSR